MDDRIGKKHVQATRNQFDRAEVPVSLVSAVQAVCMLIPMGDTVTAEIVAELIQQKVRGDITLDEVRSKTPVV